MSVFNLTSWMRRAFGLRSTTIYGSDNSNYARQSVTIDTSLSLSTVWACVKLISESIASLPCGVFSENEKGEKVPQKNSELYSILHDKPNADMTAFDFWVAVISNLLLWGNAYILKTYRGSGASKTLVSIELLRPDLMAIDELEAGALEYIYSDPLGREKYPEDRIFHLKGFTLNGRMGLSVLGFARHTFGNALALEESSGTLFANGMRAGGALTVPQFLKAEQREELRKSIVNQISGVAKSGGVIIVEGGMKYETLSMPPEDAQMLQTREFSVEEICRWFGVPPAMIGHTQKATSWGTGLEQMNIGFLTYTLTPHLKRIEQGIKASLIPPAQKAKLYAEFNVEGFLRADSAGRAALYGSASQNGWMTRAEIRRKENLPFIAGSDTLTVQRALTSLDKLDHESVSAATIEDSGKV